MGTMWLMNPAFVIPNWNESDVKFRMTLDGQPLVDGSDYRCGFEKTAGGQDLVIWLNKTIDLNEREDHNAQIEIEPLKKTATTAK